MRDFRFGFTLGTHYCLDELATTCRTAEGYGFDLALAVDHLWPNRASPFQSTLAATMATERMSAGTFVLNTGFWNPTLLAREVATAVRLSGGRFELGLGAGIVKSQFTDAGFPFGTLDERMDLLTECIDRLEELLAGEENLVRPPLLVGGTSDRAIRLGVERADIMSFGGRFQVPGQPFGTLRILTGEETAERAEFFRSAAGARYDDIEFNAFVIGVERTDDREAAAARIADEDPGDLTIEEALTTPFLLIGTEEEIADQLRSHRERYGFTSFTVQRPHMELLGPSIRLLSMSRA